MIEDYVCPECDAKTNYIIDGLRYSLEEILSMPVEPENIVREVTHRHWCRHLR